jgi:hypothetical protein
MAYAMESMTRIDSHDQLGKNLRACSSRLGCAFWSDLLAPRGTIIDSGLGPAKSVGELCAQAWTGAAAETQAATARRVQRARQAAAG